MGDHNVILKDLRKRKAELESKAAVYGEDLGAPYRDAADSLGDVIVAYDTSLPETND